MRRSFFNCRFGLLRGCKARVWLWIGVFSNELMFLSYRLIYQKATYHVYRFTHACPSLSVYYVWSMVEPAAGTCSIQLESSMLTEQVISVD